MNKKIFKFFWIFYFICACAIIILSCWLYYINNQGQVQIVNELGEDVTACLQNVPVVYDDDFLRIYDFQYKDYQYLIIINNQNINIIDISEEIQEGIFGGGVNFSAETGVCYFQVLDYGGSISGCRLAYRKKGNLFANSI